MATERGTVVSVSLETDVKKQAGGTYKAWQLVYKTPEGEIRSIAKPVTGLRFNAALKDSLASLAPNDEFTLTQEKNAAGFNDVKSIVKGFATEDIDSSSQAGVGTPAKANSSRSGSSQSNSYTQRDYETKEERAARQVSIVRQSSLSNAIATLTVGSKAALKVEEVLEVAQQYVDFVDAGNAKKVVEKGHEFDDLQDDIPY